MKQWVDGKGYVNMNELTKEHTALPWKVRVLKDDCFVEGNEVVGETVVGEYKREILADESYPKKKTDARFIVLACNHFEEMRETLKEAQSYLSRQKQSLIFKQIEALLSKLEGAK